MFKILILAYLIGTNPVETQRTFQMEETYSTMSECKANLLSQHPDQTYEVMKEFVRMMKQENNIFLNLLILKVSQMNYKE